MKVQVKLQQIKMARDYLMNIFYDAQSRFAQFSVATSSDSSKAIKVFQGHLPEEEQLRGNSAQLEHISRQQHIYSMIGNLFYSVGDTKYCEQAYVQYVDLIEKVYGELSLENSNSYFQVGVFYLQHQFYLKALGCLKK